MKSSTTKRKVMIDRGKEPIRTNIVINDEIVEQVSNFHYLRNYTGYDKNYEFKLCKLQTICETVNYIFRNKVR